jgi:hypothetical protein
VPESPPINGVNFSTELLTREHFSDNKNVPGTILLE